jgi:hypothetical protein
MIVGVQSPAAGDVEVAEWVVLPVAEPPVDVVECQRSSFGGTDDANLRVSGATWASGVGRPASVR